MINSGYDTKTDAAPMFSIITVCWNPGAAILPTVASLKDQIFQDYEFIVVDGASTDGTVDLLRAHFDGLITKLVSERDKGIYDAMNKGIGLARGRYLYFLNVGDLFFDVRVLSDVADAAVEHAYPDIVFGDVAFGKPSPAGPEGVQSRHRCDVTDLFYKPINHQSIFASRASLQDLFTTDLKMLSDYHWFMSQFVKGDTRIFYMSRIMAYYDVRGYSASNDAILKSELNVVREKFFRRGYVSLLTRIKGTRFMYFLRIRSVKWMLNRMILKKPIKRELVANV